MIPSIALLLLAMVPTSGPPVVFPSPPGLPSTSYYGPAPLAYSPDGRLLVTDSDNSTIRFWNPRTGKSLRTVYERMGPFSDESIGPPPLSEESIGPPPSAGKTIVRGLPTVAFLFLPDGKTMIAVVGDGTVGLWDVKAGKLIHLLTGEALEEGVAALALSSDGRILAVNMARGKLKLWDLRHFKLLSVLNGVNFTASSPSRSLFAIARGSKITLCSIPSMKSLQTLSAQGGNIVAMAISPDEKLLASGDEEGTVRVWDLQRGRVRLTLRKQNVVTLAFSPKGRILAAGSAGGILRLWNPLTGKLRYAVLAHQDPVFSIVFSPDGKTMATRSDQGKVKLWNPATGVVKRTFDPRPELHLSGPPTPRHGSLGGTVETGPDIITAPDSPGRSDLP